jgi:hypothetical protein
MGDNGLEVSPEITEKTGDADRCGAESGAPAAREAWLAKGEAIAIHYSRPTDRRQPQSEELKLRHHGPHRPELNIIIERNSWNSLFPTGSGAQLLE